MPASAWSWGISTDASMPAAYPCYMLQFTVNGNSYQVNLVMNAPTGTDSTDWDAAANTMASSLTSGGGYSNVRLYKFDVSVTEII